MDLEEYADGTYDNPHPENPRQHSQTEVSEIFKYFSDDVVSHFEIEIDKLTDRYHSAIRRHDPGSAQYIPNRRKRSCSHLSRLRMKCFLEASFVASAIRECNYWLMSRPDRNFDQTVPGETDITRVVNYFLGEQVVPDIARFLNARADNSRILNARIEKEAASIRESFNESGSDGRYAINYFEAILRRKVLIAANLDRRALTERNFMAGVFTREVGNAIDGNAEIGMAEVGNEEVANAGFENSRVEDIRTENMQTEDTRVESATFLLNSN